jgi:hypothetical protein
MEEMLVLLRLVSLDLLRLEVYVAFLSFVLIVASRVEGRSGWVRHRLHFGRYIRRMQRGRREPSRRCVFRSREDAVALDEPCDESRRTSVHFVIRQLLAAEQINRGSLLRTAHDLSLNQHICGISAFHTLHVNLKCPVVWAFQFEVPVIQLLQPIKIDIVVHIIIIFFLRLFCHLMLFFWLFLAYLMLDLWRLSNLSWLDSVIEGLLLSVIFHLTATLLSAHDLQPFNFAHAPVEPLPLPNQLSRISLLLVE